MHLDSLIEELGGFGRYQIMMTVVTSFAMITAVPSMIMMGFAGVEPDWWCTSRDQPFNQSHYVNNSLKNCEWNGTCQRKFSTAMTTVVSEWNLVCDLKWTTNAMIPVQMGGVLIGAIFAGYAADSYGRKKTYYTGLLTMCVMNVIAAFSVSWTMFTSMRAVVGISLGLFFTTAYPYRIEFVGKKWRIIITVIPDWTMGMIVHSLSQWLHHWKWVHLASAVLLAICLPPYWLLDESVRWLTVKGHLEDARRVVHKMAAINRKPVPDTSILELIAEEELAEGTIVKDYTYLDLFKTKDLAKKTLLTCFGWCSSSIVYYGIYFGVKSLSGDIYLNMLLMALTELPTAPLVIGFTAVLKRRWGITVSLLLTCAACFGVAVCTRHVSVDERGTYINALAMTAKLVMNVSWTILSALGVEQIPTVIRNHAYAAHGTSARIGGIVAGQVLSLGGNDLMAPFIAMGVLTFLTMLGCLTLDETQGKPLQETMKSAVIVKRRQESLTQLEQIPQSLDKE